MYNEAKLREIADKFYKHSDADKLQINMTYDRNALTRFANNVITQNICKDSFTAILKYEKNGNIAELVTNRFSDVAIKEAIQLLSKQAAEMKIASQSRDFNLVKGQSYTKMPLPPSALVELTPKSRAEKIVEAVEVVEKAGLNSFGTCSNFVVQTAVSNSEGLFASHSTAGMDFAITVSTEDSSGWAKRFSNDSNAVDAKALAATALQKAEKGRSPKEIEPGKYTVILEPVAFANILTFFIMSGFNGLAFEEGRSFSSGKLGEKLISSAVTIDDDPFHKLTVGFPFDYEGTAKKKINLMDKGSLTNMVYDTKTARKYNKQPTGHTLPVSSFAGAIPMNVVFHKGNSTLEEMIASTENGILITDYHYTNISDPMKVVVTGMTRNGAYLIKNGKLTDGIMNMRFTQNMLEALSNIEAIGSEEVFFNTFHTGGLVVPAVKIKEFNFTSKTKF